MFAHCFSYHSLSLVAKDATQKEPVHCRRSIPNFNSVDARQRHLCGFISNIVDMISGRSVAEIGTDVNVVVLELKEKETQNQHRCLTWHHVQKLLIPLLQ